MSRPLKCRKVGCQPGVSYFKPRGIPVSKLEEVVLTVDEFEAVRLADLEVLYQDVAAKRMNISRQTFGNIVGSAHKKIADAIVNGKAIKIEGGIYQMEQMRKFSCNECEHQWEVAYGLVRPQECPKCKGTHIHRADEGRGRARSGDFRRRKRKCERM